MTTPKEITTTETTSKPIRRQKSLSNSLSTGLSEFLNASSALLRTSSSGISEEKLRVRENEDRDKVWNHYKKEDTISQSKFSSVILVKRRKSRRHWKKWRKDYEKRIDPIAHSNIEKKERNEQLKKSLSSGNLKKWSIFNRSKSSMINANSRDVKDKEKKKNMINNQVAVTSSSPEEKYYIVKKIRLHTYKKAQIEILKKEVGVLKALDHPNIVRAFETYEVVGRQLNIVFEYCAGGDLWSRSPITKEKDVACIMNQILNAVAFMHERNFIHRDLKMENILFVSNNTSLDVKVIDFGLSTKMLPDKDIMTQRVGTVYTMSPEVIFRRYTNKADMWALGVIAFALIADIAPFDVSAEGGHNKGNNADAIMKAIEKGKYTFTPESIWNNITNEMKEFVSNLLKYNPKDRLSATQALNHPWMKLQYPVEDRRPCPTTLDKTNNKLMVSNLSGLKRLALYTIASRINTKEVDHIRQVFDQYDTLNNGTICFDEFKAALDEYHYTDEQLYEIFKRLAFTSTNNKLIYYTDFLSALLDEQEYIDEDKLADAFDVLDCDDSGFISSENLRHFLDENYNDDEINNILHEADLNQDGQVSFEDFLAMFDHERGARDEVRRKFNESRHSNNDNHSNDGDKTNSIITTVITDEIKGCTSIEER